MVRIDFFTQVGDMYHHRAGVAGAVRLPDMLIQLVIQQQRLWVVGKKEQQLILDCG